jgi:hypothetical protein
MNMSPYENATRRAIGENPWISERMTQAASDAADVGPKGVDLAVDEERFRDVVVGDEGAGCQVKRLAAVLVLLESWPAVWPKVGRTGEGTELFVPGVAMEDVSVSEVVKGCGDVRLGS